MPRKVRTREGYIVFFPDDAPDEAIKAEIERRRQEGRLRNEQAPSRDGVRQGGGLDITLRPPPDIIEAPTTETPKPGEYTEDGVGVLRGDTLPALSGSALMKGRVQNAMQGLGFGFADEGLGAVSATLDELGARELIGQEDPRPNATWSERYEAYRDHARDIDQHMMEERPMETLATQAGAGLLTGAAVLPKIANATIKTVAPRLAATLSERSAPILARTTEGALGGIEGGTVQGFGSGEGGFDKRMGPASLGALIGGATGGSLPTTLSAATGLSRYIGNTLGDLLPQLVNPQRRAGEIIGEGMTRSGWTPGTRGGPVDEMDEMLTTGAKDITLADASENMRSTLGAATRVPGAGQEKGMEFLRTRQGRPGVRGKGQVTDVLGAIRQFISPTVDARAAAKLVAGTRSREAQSFYQKAFGHGDIWNRELSELLSNPRVRSGLRKGIEMAQDEGDLPMTYTLPKFNDGEGDVQLPVRIWHAAKMGLDSKIGTAQRAGDKPGAKALIALQKRLLKALDDATDGDYGRARENYAGHSALLNELEHGQDFLKKEMTSADVAEHLADPTLTKNEREFYLAGVAQALSEKVASVKLNRNAVHDFIYSEGMMQKFGALFRTEPEYQAFMRRLMAEDSKFRTFSEVFLNSATAKRLAGQEDLAEGISEGVDSQALSQLASGPIRMVVNTAFKWATESNVRALKERTRNELVRMLTSTDEREVRAVAKVIQAAANRVVARRQWGRSVRAGLAQGASEAVETFGHTPAEAWERGTKPPPGFRRAKDKNWYKEDPDRPGKWLRWEPDAR